MENYNGPMNDEMLSSLLSYGGKYPQEYMRALGQLNGQQPDGPMTDEMLSNWAAQQSPQSPQPAAMGQPKALPMSSLLDQNYFVNNSTGQRYDIPSSPQSTQSSKLPDYAQPIEIGGVGKGYRVKGDPYLVLLNDGRVVQTGIDQEATDALRKKKLELQHQSLQNMFTAAQIAKATAPERQKAPEGQRFTPEGNLEWIPGSEGAAKAAAPELKKAAGQQEFSSEIDNIRGLYDKLNELKALPSTGRGALSNLASSAQSSAVGQFAGKTFGTEEQKLRDEISSGRMRLVQALKNATGMSAQQMNSNVELKNILDSLGDTSKSYEANVGILDQLQKRYGGGAKANNQAAPPVPTSSIDYQQTVFNAKKAIARNPAAREAIIQKMQAAGYDTGGL